VKEENQNHKEEVIIMAEEKDKQSTNDAVKDSYVHKTSEYILPSEAIKADIPLGTTKEEANHEKRK
jgi:hypothetical protein